jgi:hypothetical protein
MSEFLGRFSDGPGWFSEEGCSTSPTDIVNPPNILVLRGKSAPNCFVCYPTGSPEKSHVAGEESPDFVKKAFQECETH